MLVSSIGAPSLRSPSVLLGTLCALQVGWAAEKAAYDPSQGYGVGDDPLSWGWCVASPDGADMLF